MSIIACWRTFEGTNRDRIYLVADSLYSTVAGGSITPLLHVGQKVYQIPIRAFLVGNSSPRRLLVETTIGLSFTGNVILGQGFAGLASSTLGNLYGFSNSKLPSLELIVRRLCMLLARMAEHSEYRGKNSCRVEGLIVGNCPVSQEPQIFWYGLDPTDSYKPKFRRIRLSTPDNLPLSNFELTGDGISTFSHALDLSRQNIQHADEVTQSPLDTLQKIVSSGQLKSVGGEIHGGILTSEGFRYRSFHRIKKVFRNGGFAYDQTFVNFDLADLPKMDDFQFIAHPFIEFTWLD